MSFSIGAMISRTDLMTMLMSGIRVATNVPTLAGYFQSSWLKVSMAFST